MYCLRHSWRRSAPITVLASLGVAATLALPTAAVGQGRNPGRSGGGSSGGDSGRHSSSSSSDSGRRESYRSAPSYHSAPREEYRPTYHYTPRQEYQPSPSRVDSYYQRGGSSTTHDPFSDRRPSSYSRPEDPVIRRDYRSDTAPARDYRTPLDTATRSHDTYARPIDRAPSRPIDRASSIDRAPSRPIDRALRTDSQGAGSIFSRRDPVGSHGTSTRDGSVRTPDRYAYRDRARYEGVHPQVNEAQRIFTRSEEGRRFENGIVLRPGCFPHYAEVCDWYPHYCYYPYYYPSFAASLTFFSPYCCYYDVCAPFILRTHCFYAPPPVVYVEVPVYVGDEARGYGDEDNYYLSRSYDAADPGLRNAIDDIRAAFMQRNIEPLVNLTDPQVRIAVFRQGKYDYSMSANDYLDMTRDALGVLDTLQFDLYQIHRRSVGVYVVSGKHIYRDKDGSEHMVYVSFVLENLRGRWTITQVGTAPDRIREWR